MISNKKFSIEEEEEKRKSIFFVLSFSRSLLSFYILNGNDEKINNVISLVVHCIHINPKYLLFQSNNKTTDHND
jgi:hypothetical protein